MTTHKVGRNDPCSCGSGKKYKHCCEQAGAGNSTSNITVQSPKQSAPAGFSAQQALQTAMAQHQAGNLPQAEALYKQVLQATPNQPDALHLLGLIAKQKGDLKTASQLMRNALTVNPNYVEAYVNLGATLQEQGNLNDAADCYRKALTLRPNYAEVHSNLGVVLKELGNLNEAAECFLRAIALKPDFAEAFTNLDALLKEMSEPDEALVYYRRVLEISPTLIAAQQGAYQAISRIVPEWHVPMMNEQNRNQAYFDALKTVIKPDSKVFEIGTGSGLLAMMAAKLGAKQVTTCEAIPLIAETAKQIVNDNKFEKTIKVIAKKSVNVEVGTEADKDMPEQADILVSEIFSSELLGEHVLPSLEDAKRRLLKPQGQMIPAAGSIMIALFTGNDIRRNLIVDDSFGFNLQHFNTIVSKKRMIARNDLNIELLSDDIEAFNFDFENESFFPSQAKSLRIPINASGRCYGIVQWMRLQMAKDIVFENHPSQKSAVSNWQQCAYLFDEPIDVEVGQVVVVNAEHNRAVPWFWLDSIE